ncbi:uncharacterized protein TNIN_39441 [Trichonephila inaurata madagascariensis]|nr:uncharacterized protein TNIN_39441 [Trichonephila inaurata madagascariensis]
MKVGKGPEVDITYEKIIEDEYGKILVKQELLSLAEQGQHLADSGKSKEEDRKMVKFIRSSYFRVLEWFEQHIHFFSDVLDNAFYEKIPLYWTESLMIDKEKTAKSLVSNKELLGCAKRYELACLYCFESSIKQLWMDLEEKEKKRYGEESASSLVEFWTSRVEKEVEVKDYIFGFELAVEYGAESSIQYFLDCLLSCKIQQQTKEEVLVNSAIIVAGKSCFNIEQAVNYANVFDRLFKEIKKMQGDFSRIRERFPYYFLNYFLNHETDGFLDRMRECSGCLPQCDYQRLLSNIAAKGHKQLFIEFLNFGKGEGLQRINRVKEDILPFLFQLEDEDIEKILDDFTPEEKKIIISYIKDNIYSLVVLEGKSRLLKLVISKCFHDKERNKFMKSLVDDEGCSICVNSVIRDKGRLADDFLSLCFPQNQDKINELKKSMLFCNIVKVTNVILDYHAESTSDGLNTQFEKVFKWGAFLDNEQNKFKEQIIDSKGCSVCVGFIRKGDNGSADGFLNWCLSRDEDKVNKFKQKLVFRGRWGRDFCVSNMRNKKSGVVENFLRWLSLPEEQHKKLLSQCEGILTKHGTDDICSELEVIFRSVLENKKQLRKRPRVSDGCTEKPEAKSSRTLGSPDCSVQEVKLEEYNSKYNNI